MKEIPDYDAAKATAELISERLSRLLTLVGYIRSDSGACEYVREIDSRVWALVRAFKREHEGNRPSVGPFVTKPEYESLANVLARALSQAADGKGKERHANPGERFEDQQICTLNRWLGDSHGAVFQVCKKAIESQRLDVDAGVRELLGAIVYAAAAVVEMERKAQETPRQTVAPTYADASNALKEAMKREDAGSVPCPRCNLRICMGHD